jgi:hypothetical protein
MSDAYVIELKGNAVGILVRKPRDERNYRFLSALHFFNSLEGQEFSGPLQAEKAARKILKESPHVLQEQTFEYRY